MTMMHDDASQNQVSKGEFEEPAAIVHCTMMEISVRRKNGSQLLYSSRAARSG